MVEEAPEIPSFFVSHKAHSVTLVKARQAHQSPPASPPPPVLPDELMVEILSWLPVKEILKLRCVGTSWKSLISDPKFVKLHLLRSARNPNLLLVCERKPHDFLVPCSVRSLLGNPSSSTIDEDDCFPSNGNKYGVIGSCNGLVCLACFPGISNQNQFRDICFCLCNPATKLTSEEFACPYFDDSSYCHMFAFGYDNVSDTYKLSAFFCDFIDNEEPQKHKVKICSFGDTCWRNIQSFPVNPFYNFKHPHNKAEYFNGTLNWLALCNINSAVIAQFVIVSLHLGMEACTELLLPRLDEALQVDPRIVVLMDCLCFSHDSNRTHFVVWLMKDFGVEKSWIQFMKVSYQDLQFDCLKYPLIPLCTSDDGDVLIMTTILEQQPILYHRRYNRVERTKLPNYIQWYCTKGYVESLVLPSSVADLQT